MATKKTSAIPNWKKKKWYEIVAPPSFSDKPIGETLLESPDQLKGKVVGVNMMTLLGTPKKQSFRMKFIVTEVVENKGITKPIVLEMIPASIKRLIKAGKERIDASFTVKTKDGMTLRIKPLIITRDKTTNSRLADIQQRTKELLQEYAAKNDYESMFVNVSQSTLQKELKHALDKVYPIKLFEIRVIEVEVKEGRRL
jgi:small subunit ribosomal protein S3Ae